MLSAGMKGVTHNSGVSYFVLAAAGGPTFIVYGYLLSFVVQDFVQCHQCEYTSNPQHMIIPPRSLREVAVITGVGNWLNVTYSLFWMTLTFGVQPGSEIAATLEACFCLMPGFAFYQGIGKLEVAAVNGAPFTWQDTFDYDRGIWRSILFLWLDFVIFCAMIYVIDTEFFSRMTGPKLDAVVGIDDDQRELLDVLPPVVGATSEQRTINTAHAEDLSKRYMLESGASVQAVRHTSIGVPKDCIMGLLGPNGAGKTTMVR